MATYRCWAQSGVTQRANSTAYSLGDRMQPAITDTSTNHAIAKRFVWECTTAGTSGASVPTWSASYTVDTSTITDGTVTWTCRAPGYSSGSTVDWTFASIFASYTTPRLAANDELLIHYTSSEASNSSPHTLAPTADRCLLISVDKDNSEAYQAMGTSGVLFNTTANGGNTLSPGRDIELRVRGLTLRQAGSGGLGNIVISGGDNSQLVAEDLRLELTSSSSAATLSINSLQSTRSATRLIRPVFHRDTVGQQVVISGNVEILGGSTAGSASISTVFETRATTQQVSANVRIVGFDMTTGVSSTATLVKDGGETVGNWEFHGCILPSSYTILSGTGNTNESGVHVLLVNCKAGSTDGIHAYANALGSAIRNTTIKHGSETFSWKIDSASSSRNAPFSLPWMWGQIATGASVTPKIQLARDGSSTAFTDAEVWMESCAQVTASSPVKTFASTEAAYSSAGSNLGSGSGSWTGLGGTNWTGQIAAAAITPTGDEFQARLCVATTNTVYAAQGWET